jgi:hypothetical protein
MSARPLAVLGLLTAFATACEPDPTAPPYGGDPQFASAGSPRFTAASATGPNSVGQLAIAFQMAGVGAKASNLITANAAGRAVWACRFGTQEFDGFPAPQIVVVPVSSTSAAAMSRGQISGSLALSTPGNSLDCAAGHHRPVLVSTEFTSAEVTHPDAQPLAIPGTFAQTYHTLPTGTLPTITSVQLAHTTFTIEGDAVSSAVTIENTGFLIPVVILQAWIKQGDTWRAAGGPAFNCGGEPNELPTGSCTLQANPFASNSAAGEGTLVPGAAVLEFIVRESPSVRALAGWRVNITLQ